MNTCDTCKYWNPLPNTLGYVRVFTICGNPILDDVDGMIEGKEKGVPGKGNPAGAFGGAIDSEGSYFATGPKFGCIHHEQKAA